MAVESVDRTPMFTWFMC